MTRSRCLWCSVLCLLCSVLVPCLQAQTPQSSPRAVLDKYCVTCHNERLKTAGLMLDRADADHPGSNAQTFEKVLRKLRSREMPPPGMPRPDEATYAAVVNAIENERDRLIDAKHNPGRPTLHRLNRAEYANAIRDLLALDVDV